jgi:hypothetical protein
MSEGGALTWEDGELLRHPVLIAHNVIALLTMFEAKNSFNDLWTIDLEGDPIERDKNTAREFLKPLRPHLSVNMLWSLREALAEEIKWHNEGFVCAFPVDRPNES